MIAQNFSRWFLFLVPARFTEESIAEEAPNTFALPMARQQQQTLAQHLHLIDRNHRSDSVSAKSLVSSPHTPSVLAAELAEQKTKLRSLAELRVDAEVNEATLKCQERTIVELTSQYRETLAQLHAEKEELDKISQDRDRCNEAASVARREYQKGQDQASKASKRIYELEVRTHARCRVVEATLNWIEHPTIHLRKYFAHV
jgi:chromosome segregation ATPase